METNTQQPPVHPKHRVHKTLTAAYVAIVVLTLQATQPWQWTTSVLSTRRAKTTYVTTKRKEGEERKEKKVHRAAPASRVAQANPLLDADGFPAFDHAVFPFAQTPNWGFMRSAKEWDRPYEEMTARDFVAIPPYDLAVLTVPLAELTANRTAKNNAIITAKLFYSTRYYGSYDIDSDEFMWVHPGVDLKVALHTPVRAIGGGRVKEVSTNDSLGLYVIVEHHVPGEGTLYSVYGHFDTTNVVAGQDIAPGHILGTVGMTGNTQAPHLHLQIDTDTGGSTHVPYWPDRAPDTERAARATVNPIHFIQQHAS